MQTTRFDQLARALSAANTRRGMLHVLAALPLAGWLSALLGEEEAAADGRRKRRKKRHKHGRPGPRHRHSHKKKRKCTPESPAETCADRCGTVTNDCNKPVDCGSCECAPPCPVCKTCEGEPGVPGICVPADLGEPCGAPGEVCQTDGACACIPTTCMAQGAECGSIADGCGGMLECGSCTDPLAPICDASNTCAACSATTCADGCCDGVTCRIGEINACGTDGGTCVDCRAVDFCDPGPCPVVCASPCGCVAGRGCCLEAGNRPLDQGVGCEACCAGVCTGPADDQRCAQT